MREDRRFDAAVVGAGPAGLSAALVLARCCRDVFVCDAATPRNAATQVMHGFLTRDGIAPAEFNRLARDELRRYPNVVLRWSRAVDARRASDAGFELELDDGLCVHARKLLIATGLVDELPAIPGLSDFWGSSVFHCPYCDGYEVRDQPLGVLGRRERGLELARALRGWSRDVTLLSNGPSDLGPDARRSLERNGIRQIESRIARLSGRGGQLESVLLDGGEQVALRALFLDTRTRPQSLLALRVGCKLTRKEGIRCGRYEATDVPGVFVAGNITRDVQLSIVAAAEGARAAFGIHRSLVREEFEESATGRRPLEHPEVDDAGSQGRHSGGR
jgi:thioredoxin reductase